MIKRKKLTVTALVVVLSLSSLAMLQGQTSQENACPISKSSTPKLSADKIKKSFPLTEFLNKSNSNSSRKAKSKKYNKNNVLNPNITEDEIQMSSYDWATGLSPLPVEKSQIVIIGKVVDAQAHLSENEKSVYSEFKIEIKKVLKNNEQISFEEDKYITVEREGGVVQYPSGYKTLFAVQGQQMPVVGQEYVFFITNEFPIIGRQENDLYLITAYELKNGLVFPLDYPGAGTHSLARVYNGKAESFFMDELLKSLSNSSNQLPK